MSPTTSSQSRPQSVNFDLSGRVAIVTGAARGMGKAVAEGLAACGAQVVIADLNGEQAEETAEEIRGTGAAAVAVKADHTDPAAVDAIMRTAEAHFGPIDILVNNAGILSLYSFVDMTMEQWDHVMNVNLRGPLLCMKAILPGMLERRRGSIVCIGSSFSSRSSVFNFPGGGPDYVVSKSAIQSLTRCVAQQGAPFGVRANAIGPGCGDTPMHAENQELLATMIPYIPLNRLQTSDDIAGTAVWLASDASSYVTGQTIHVNGGMIMVD